LWGFRSNFLERFLILGTDGLWDYLKEQEAVDIVFQGMKNKDSEAVVAERLVTRALEIAAAESGLSLTELKRLPQGKHRRSRHDDTTAVVIYFG
jgi:pyruvate dehydrogenase phosphatase